MGLKKGMTNNLNGRPAGQPNKVSTDLRQWLTDFLDDNREQVLKDWKSLESKDRLILFERLLKYSLPTLQATSLTTNEALFKGVDFSNYGDNEETDF